jgi:hypothetical protein
MVDDTAHLSASPSLTLSAVAQGLTVSVQEASLVRNSILRRPRKIHETSTARLQVDDEGSHLRHEDELDSASARNLAPELRNRRSYDGSGDGHG